VKCKQGTRRAEAAEKLSSTPRRAEASEEEVRVAASAMKFMKLGSKPDAFQTDGSDAR